MWDFLQLLHIPIPVGFFGDWQFIRTFNCCHRFVTRFKSKLMKLYTDADACFRSLSYSKVNHRTRSRFCADRCKFFVHNFNIVYRFYFSSYCNCSVAPLAETTLKAEKVRKTVTNPLSFSVARFCLSTRILACNVRRMVLVSYPFFQCNWLLLIWKYVYTVFFRRKFSLLFWQICTLFLTNTIFLSSFHCFQKKFSFYKIVLVRLNRWKNVAKFVRLP